MDTQPTQQAPAVQRTSTAAYTVYVMLDFDPCNVLMRMIDPKIKVDVKAVSDKVRFGPDAPPHLYCVPTLYDNATSNIYCGSEAMQFVRDNIAAQGKAAPPGIPPREIKIGRAHV